MPEAVLAGANGQPAVDAVTGLPLTMEELLRRRGILAYKGVASPLNVAAPTETVAATPANTELAASADATAANSDGSNAAIGASPDSLDETGTPIGATIATPTLKDPTVEEGSSDWMEWLAGAGLLGAAAYGASKLRRKNAAVGAAPEAVVGEVLPSDYTINNSLTRVGDTGSHQTLDALIDSKNVSKAGAIGAGPKALSGPLPVENLEGDISLASSVAEQRRLANEYEGPSRGPQSRQEYGARKQSYMREGSTNDNVIQMRDRFTDLSPDELTLAKEIAGRLKSIRDTGEGKLPARIGTTKVAKRNAKARKVTSDVRTPMDQGSQTLLEAVKMVRQMKAQGVNVTSALRRIGR
jgi:hypothetical protein